MHAVFGKVVNGMDVLNQIRERDPNQGPDFLGDGISTIAITESDA